MLLLVHPVAQHDSYLGLLKEGCYQLYLRADGVSKLANVDVAYTYTCGDHNYGCRLWFVGAAELPASNDVIDKALALFKCECYLVCELTFTCLDNSA